MPIFGQFPSPSIPDLSTHTDQSDSVPPSPASMPIFGQFPSPSIPDLSTHTGSTNLFVEDVEALSTFLTPEIFRSFLANQRGPGGFLAPGQQTQEFAIQAGGAVDQLAGQRRDLRADLGGLNPTFARSAERNLEFNALGNILDARVGASAQAAERNFLADQAFANALAATDVAQKQQTLQGLQFNVDIASQLKAAREGKRAATTGALIGGAADLLGAFKGLF